jgi:hypothetical protein
MSGLSSILSSTLKRTEMNCMRLSSDIISQHLVDPSSILSAATLTSVCHSLLKTNGLSESLIVSLLQEVQTHNSLDYLQAVVVDVIEDLQELENSRQEEKGKVAKDSSVELQQSDASRSVRVLQALLVSVSSKRVCFYW